MSQRLLTVAEVLAYEAGYDARSEEVTAEIARLTAELYAARERDLIPTCYEIRGTAHPTPHHIVRVEARDQRDGKRLWVVAQLGNVLRRDGEWEIEPQPSSRTDDFIRQTRFASPDEALAAFRALASTPPDTEGGAAHQIDGRSEP